MFLVLRIIAWIRRPEHKLCEKIYINIRELFRNTRFKTLAKTLRNCELCFQEVSYKHENKQLQSIKEWGKMSRIANVNDGQRDYKVQKKWGISDLETLRNREVKKSSSCK